MPGIKARVAPSIAGLVTLGLGLALRASCTGWFAKYGGVALWSTLVYFLILWVSPMLSPRRALVSCVGISFAVEFLQLTPGPLWLSEVHFVFALVFGTTFNAPDLPAYVVGSLLGAVIHVCWLTPPASATD